MAMTDNEKRVLRVILELGIVSGRDLRRKSGVDYHELSDAVQRLMSDGLLDTGEDTDPNHFARALFNFRPSAEDKIAIALIE